jgi:nucleoid-associated protein YgaU
VALSYYESGFNPKSESVDVGNKNDKGSWSVGLYQMSGNDGAAKALGVDYLGLKDPIKNINVAMYQMNTQIKNTGLFILPNSSKYRYWAIILDSNKYNKVSDVIARVQKHAAFCK